MILSYTIFYSVTISLLAVVCFSIYIYGNLLNGGSGCPMFTIIPIHSCLCVYIFLENKEGKDSIVCSKCGADLKLAHIVFLTDKKSVICVVSRWMYLFLCFWCRIRLIVSFHGIESLHVLINNPSIIRSIFGFERFRHIDGSVCMHSSIRSSPSLVDGTSSVLSLFLMRSIRK